MENMEPNKDKMSIFIHEESKSKELQPKDTTINTIKQLKENNYENKYAKQNLSTKNLLHA